MEPEPQSGFSQLAEAFRFAGYEVFSHARQADFQMVEAAWARTLDGSLRHVGSFLSHDSGFPPDWIDLMMWATLSGKPLLARPLFEKTDHPLRAALMASRFCRQQASRALHASCTWRTLRA